MDESNVVDLVLTPTGKFEEPYSPYDVDAKFTNYRCVVKDGQTVTWRVTIIWPELIPLWANEVEVEIAHFRPEWPFADDYNHNTHKYTGRLSNGVWTCTSGVVKPLQNNESRSVSYSIHVHWPGQPHVRMHKIDPLLVISG